MFPFFMWILSQRLLNLKGANRVTVPLRMQFQTLELTAHSCEEEEGVKTLGEWVKEATAWVDDKCLDWTGGCLQKHLAHACTCLHMLAHACKNTALS